MATYVSFDTFVPEILQYCHGAPTILIRTHVRNAIIKFLERTLILKKQPSSFYLDEDEHTYTLKYNNDRYRALSIKECRLGDDETDANYRKIRVVSEHEMDSTINKWRIRNGKDPLCVFLKDETNQLRFYPIPNQDSDKEIFMDTVVTIKRDQTEIDDFIRETWEEVIQAGALASLLRIPGASWLNVDLANDFTRVWKRGIRNARATSLRGKGELAGQVQPRNYTGSDYHNEYGGYTRWV